MTTPPRVTERDMADAIARITARHRRADRPAQHLLTDDPREVIAYLRRCGSAGLLEDEHSHDLEDLLVLRIYLLWEGLSDEKWALDVMERLLAEARRARRAGEEPATPALDRRRAGRPFGIRSGQGVHDRHDRLIALFGPSGRPHQRFARIERGTAAGFAPDTPPAPAPAAAPRSDVRAALAELLARLDPVFDDLPDDLADDLTSLKRETGRYAQLSDPELINYLPLVLLDLGDVDLPPAARRAADALAAAVTTARQG